MEENLRVAYENQKRAAKFRKIEWLFTFDEWRDWWVSTGKLDLRGNTKDKPYMMCRYKDSGPYSPSNVYCGTVTQNNTDAWTHNPNHKIGGIANMTQERRTEIGKLGRSKVKTVTSLKQSEIDSRLKKISHIDMMKYGWVAKVANVLGISHTQARRFVNKYYQGTVFCRTKK